MTAYIIKRLLLAIPTILGAMTLIFFAMRLTPGDPAALFVPPDVSGQSSAQLYAKIRHEYGFDQPLYVQYYEYLKHVARLDFGTSLRYKQPVSKELAARIPNTLQLGLISLVIATVLGIGLGIISAVSRGSWLDNTSVVGALLGISVPSFWLALMMKQLSQQLLSIENKLESEPDLSKRQALAKQAQMLYQQNQLTAWMWHSQTITAIEPYLKDYELTWHGRIINLNKAWLDK